MELIGGVLVFLLMVVVFGPERKTRHERDMLEAFPKNRWTVYYSLDNDDKWGIYRGGIMYKEFDTEAEAQEKADSLN